MTLALSGLDSLKAYGPDGVPPVVLKNWASGFAPCLVKSFVCVSLLLLIFLAGNLLTFNLSLKRVTAAILQTTVHEASGRW